MSDSSDKEAIVIPKPDEKTASSLTILMSRDDSEEMGECSYCDEKRHVIDPYEKGKPDSELKEVAGHKYQMHIVTSHKIKCDDAEKFFLAGYTRCGAMFYKRTNHKSCCEVFQYRVDVTQFKMSRSQKQVMRRFHRYLNTGDIHLEPKGEDKQMADVEEKKEKEQDATDLILAELKQQIEQKVKHLDVALNENWEKSHKVTFNPKFKCISSNIVFQLKKKNDDEQVLGQLVGTMQQVAVLHASHIKEVQFDRKKAPFFNFMLTDETLALFMAQLKPKQKQEKGKKEYVSKKMEGVEETKAAVDPSYIHYKNYVDDSDCPYEPVAKPAHKYTISLHRAVMTDELAEIYTKYEKAVHNKERDRSFLEGHLVNSPMFDPNNVDDKIMSEEPAVRKSSVIDKMADRQFKDEGVLPGGKGCGKGAFHMYHRIDGKLVGVGTLDLTKTICNSEYFLFDPDYKHLSLGVVGAIHELQYMKKLRQDLNKDMQYYQLGELVINAPKVNYKLNYKPGLVVCPRTNQMIEFDKVKEKIKEYTRMPIEYKKEKFHDTGLYLIEQEGLNEREKYMKELAKDDDELVEDWPMWHEETQWIQPQMLNFSGERHCSQILLCLLAEHGYDFVSKLLIEFKSMHTQEEKEAEAKKADEEQAAKDAEGDSEMNEDK